MNDNQKTNIRNDPDQEFILLIDETGKFELEPYEQINNAANGNANIRAFAFKRPGTNCVVYWHTSGGGTIALKLDPEKIHLYKQLGKEIQVIKEDGRVVVPVGDRQFMETTLDMEILISAFEDAVVL